MYGAQTFTHSYNPTLVFENDVEMYGAQTAKIYETLHSKFENDVEMYGAQTEENFISVCSCLRMM